MQEIENSILDKPVRFSMTGYLKLIRFGNLAIIVFTQYFLRVFLIGPSDRFVEILSDLNLLLLSLSTVLIAAAGYIINDYYDVKIDSINKPDKVIVGRVLKRRAAIWGHIILNTAGIVIAALVYWPIGLINFFAAFLLWWYSNQLKRTILIGNIVISLLTATAIFVISIPYPANRDMVLMYAFFAFFITLIREIIKDIEDLKGDRTFGCKTLPVVVGIPKSRLAIYITIALFIINSYTWLIVINHSGLLISFSILLFPLGYTLFLISKADKVKDFSKLSAYFKIIMILGVLSMLMA